VVLLRTLTREDLRVAHLFRAPFAERRFDDVQVGADDRGPLVAVVDGQHAVGDLHVDLAGMDVGAAALADVQPGHLGKEAGDLFGRLRVFVDLDLDPPVSAGAHKPKICSAFVAHVFSLPYPIRNERKPSLLRSLMQTIAETCWGAT